MRYTSHNEAILYVLEMYIESPNGDYSDIYEFINKDIRKLTEWVYEYDDSFLEGDNYYFMFSINDIFYADEDISDYYHREELDALVELFPGGVLDWVSGRIESKLECDEFSAIHYTKRGNTLLSLQCDIWGQAGPHFSNFKLYKNNLDLIIDNSSELILYSPNGRIVSHTNEEVLDLYKRHVYNRLVPPPTD